MTLSGSPDTITDDAAMMRRLAFMIEESADLPDIKALVLLYSLILPLLREADLKVTPSVIATEEIASKMAEGVPLLCGLDLEFDEDAALDLMVRLAKAAERLDEQPQCIGSTQSVAHSAGSIRLALEEHKLDAGELLFSIVTDDSSSLISAALSLQLDPGLLRTIVQNTLKPALRAWCRQLTPLSDTTVWQKGYCFICGARAMLGELRGHNQARHLRCGQCGADWKISRLQCALCGNEDHKSSGYFRPEGAGDKVRVEFCDKCKGYIKVFTSFARMAPETLDIEDLATLHMDCIAKNRGYTR
jgi:hypothetical protein